MNYSWHRPTYDVSCVNHFGPCSCWERILLNMKIIAIVGDVVVAHGISCKMDIF